MAPFGIFAVLILILMFTPNMGITTGEYDVIQDGTLKTIYYSGTDRCQGSPYWSQSQTVEFDGKMRCNGGYERNCVHGVLLLKIYGNVLCSGEPIIEYTSNKCYANDVGDSFKYKCQKRLTSSDANVTENDLEGGSHGVVGAVAAAVILCCIIAVIGCYLGRNRCYFGDDAQKSRLLVNQL